MAHRLRTIAFYDAVLVLDQGELIEYDAPLTLLEKPDSTFRAMAMQTGEFDVLLKIAKEATEARGREGGGGGTGKWIQEGLSVDAK